MSFLKNLFGGGGAAKAAAAPKTQEYNGYLITATPYQEGGQFQTCGIITRDVAGIRKEHKFIRADRFSSLDEAAEFSIGKGRQIVDSMGDRMFG